MSVNISEMEPYVISLDSIDKQYIYRSICVPDSDLSKVRPLWSRQSLNGENQYYEFQIIPENVKEEPQRHKEYEKFLCHVCNINIPIAFLKEHYASEKHNTFKKLTKKVLDRVAKSINMCTYIDTNVPNNLYYCTSCSIVISNNEKLLHDLSDEHIKSLKYDKHMSEFLNLYIDKDYKMKCDNNCGAKMDNSNNNNENKGANCVSNISMNLHSNSDTKIDKHLTKGSYSDVVNINKTKNISIKSENDNTGIVMNSNNDSATSSVCNDNNISDLYLLEENESVIEPMAESSDIDMATLLFSTENSISVYNSSTNTIESINDTDISSLVKTINDNEIKMDVNNDTTNRNGAIIEKKYYAQINVTKTNVNNDNLKTTGAINGKSVTAQSDNSDIKTYLNNDALIPISVLKEQIEATPDDGSFKDEDCIILHTNKSEVLVPQKNYHGFIDTYAKTFCKLCSTFTEGATKLHVITAKHLSLLTKPINIDFIREMNASLCHCIICNIMISRTNKTHVNSDTHKKLLNDYTKNLTKRSNQTYCKPCDKHIDTHNYLSHIKGQKHILLRFNTNGKEENSDFLNEGRNSSEKICCICKVYIPNTDKNIIEHIKAGNHTTNMMNLIKDNKITLLADNYYYCEICKTDFDNLMSHIKIERHKLGLCKEVLSKRANETRNTPINKNVVVKNVLPQPTVKHNNDIKKIKTVSKNNDTVRSDPILDPNFCEVCKVKMPSNGRSVHEAGKNHKQKLSTLGITPNTVAGLKNVNDTLNLKNDTNESVQYKNHIYNEFMELTDNNQMLCKLCKSTIGNNESHINEHIRGKKHCNNLQTLMRIFKPPS